MNMDTNPSVQIPMGRRFMRAPLSVGQGRLGRGACASDGKLKRGPGRVNRAAPALVTTAWRC